LLIHENVEDQDPLLVSVSLMLVQDAVDSGIRKQARNAAQRHTNTTGRTTSANNI
jgi:hypothetical protein